MSLFLDCVNGLKVERPPVWFMRQAGRYLSDYRKTRAKAGSFLDLCYNSDLATEVTLQPIEKFGFDAAILFADILLILDALGVNVQFVEGQGPLIEPVKEKKDIQDLLEYSIKRLHPEILKNKNKYLEFFKKIVENQIKLIVEWQRVGFIHGVMNTDNMALSGETIDYGPLAFMDEYNPKKVFSSIDKGGRYAFNNQPKIALWNLARFAETIIHLIDKNQEIAIKKVEDVLKKGDEVRVKLIKIDDQGRLDFSRKALLEKPEGYVERPKKPRGDNNRNKKPFKKRRF